MTAYPIKPYTSGLLQQVKDVVHGFFGREGGVSKAPFSSLNCARSVGDREENILENERRIMTFLDFPDAALVGVRQVHGKTVRTVTEPWPVEQAPKADGLVTRVPGIALGILSADCGPVLFADTNRSIIGACHAGWRGAFGGVLQETVKAMEALGSHRHDIVAALGPTIAQESYEVDPVFHQTFLERDPSLTSFFQKSVKVGHFLFNLPGFIEKELLTLDLKKVHILGENTFSGPFFSRRRSLKNQLTHYGCGLSVIMLSSAGRGAY